MHLHADASFIVVALACAPASVKQMVVSILPAIFWRQQIGWSVCRQSMVWSQYKEKGHFVRKMLSSSCNVVMVRCYGWYANGLQFDFRLAEFETQFRLLTLTSIPKLT